MSNEKKFCKTCNWGVTDGYNKVTTCIRKVVVDRVEGPRIVPLSPRFQRSIFGGCGPHGKYWERLSFRETGSLDRRLIP